MSDNTMTDLMGREERQRLLDAANVILGHALVDCTNVFSVDEMLRALATLGAYEALVGEMVDNLITCRPHGSAKKPIFLYKCALCKHYGDKPKTIDHVAGCPMNHPLVREALGGETGGENA